MKKHDYEKIEEWAKEGFEKSRKSLRYGAHAERLKTTVSDKAGKKRKSAYFKPALQLAGAFLAAVIVGGGTFGVLKYMEYKGASSDPPVTDNATQGDDETVFADSQSDAVTEKEAQNKVLYNDKGDGTGFVTLRTGESCYTPGLYKSKARVRTSETSVEDEKYDTEKKSGGMYVYEDDIELINNVSDRKMTVLSVGYLRMGDDVWCGTHTVEGLQKEFDKNNMGTDGKFVVAPDGTYWIEMLVTWDDPDLSDVGDRYDIYELNFLLELSGRNTFKSGTALKNLQYANKGGVIDLLLPLDHGYGEVRQYEVPAAEARGFSVYSYIRTDDQTEQLCITDKDGSLLFASDTKPGAELQDSIVYAVGQSDEKMFFYTEEEMITFSGRVVPLTSLYRYDAGTHTKELLTQIGPDAYVTDTDKYQKMIWETYTGFSYYELYGRLFLGVGGIDETVPNFDVVSLKSAEITYENGKYVIEDPYPNGFLNVPHKESFDYSTANPITAKSGGGSEFYPECTGWLEYENGELKDENLIDIIPSEHSYDGQFMIYNSLRNDWEIMSVKVNGKEYSSLDAALSYVNNKAQSGEIKSFDIELEVSWSGRQNVKCGNYVKYIFAAVLTVG